MPPSRTLACSHNRALRFLVADCRIWHSCCRAQAKRVGVALRRLVAHRARSPVALGVAKWYEAAASTPVGRAGASLVHPHIKPAVQRTCRAKASAAWVFGNAAGDSNAARRSKSRYKAIPFACMRLADGIDEVHAAWLRGAGRRIGRTAARAPRRVFIHRVF